MIACLPKLGEAVLRVHCLAELEERLKAGPKWEDTGLIFDAAGDLDSP
jgi:hypothetical protein